MIWLYNWGLVRAPRCGSQRWRPPCCAGKRVNPVERIWHYLRSHWLANSVFPSLADIMDACEMAWNRFATNHGLIRSLCAVALGSGFARPIGGAR